MITSSAQRIADYRERGWWGDLSLHGMLRQHAQQHPGPTGGGRPAQPSRHLTGDASGAGCPSAELNHASDNLGLPAFAGRD